MLHRLDLPDGVPIHHPAVPLFPGLPGVCGRLVVVIGFTCFALAVKYLRVFPAHEEELFAEHEVVPFRRKPPPQGNRTLPRHLSGISSTRIPPACLRVAMGSGDHGMGRDVIIFRQPEDLKPSPRPGTSCQVAVGAGRSIRFLCLVWAWVSVAGYRARHKLRVAAVLDDRSPGERCSRSGLFPRRWEAAGLGFSSTFPDRGP